MRPSERDGTAGAGICPSAGAARETETAPWSPSSQGTMPDASAILTPIHAIASTAINMPDIRRMRGPSFQLALCGRMTPPASIAVKPQEKPAQGAKAPV
jgi:hypothetical protein